MVRATKNQPSPTATLTQPLEKRLPRAVARLGLLLTQVQFLEEDLEEREVQALEKVFRRLRGKAEAEGCLI